MKQTLAMGLIPIIALLCAACSQDTSERASEDARPVVNIGRLICGGHLSLAVVEKHFQQQLKHMRLNTVQNHRWDDVVADMRSGKLAGTFILSPLAMQLIRDGLPARIVMLADRNGNGFILSRKFHAIEDLHGSQSVLAVPHLFSQHHLLLHLALQAHHVSDADVKVVAMPPRDMINSLQRGEIDGFVVGEPEANRSLALETGWMAAISPDIWKDHPDHVFIASNTFIEQHPEQLQELIGALKRGGEYIEAHPHEAAIMGEAYTGASAPVFEQVLTDPPDWIDYSDMVPSTDRIQQLARVMVETGLWHDIPADLDDYVDLRFIRNASGSRSLSEL